MKNRTKNTSAAEQENEFKRSFRFVPIPGEGVVEHRNTRWGANAYRGKAADGKPVVVYAVSESTLDEVQQDGDSYRTCIEREMTMHSRVAGLSELAHIYPKATMSVPRHHHHHHLNHTKDHQTTSGVASGSSNMVQVPQSATKIFSPPVISSSKAIGLTSINLPKNAIIIPGKVGGTAIGGATSNSSTTANGVRPRVVRISKKNIKTPVVVVDDQK